MVTYQPGGGNLTRKTLFIATAILLISCLVLLMVLLLQPHKIVPVEREEDRYLQRNKQIKRTCKKYGIPVKDNMRLGKGTAKLNMYQKQWLEYEQIKKTNGLHERIPLIRNKKYSLCFCYIPKVGSTSWKTLFYSLTGKQVTPGQALKANVEFGVKRASVQRVLADNSTLSFFFSRHPFDRLVSAYVSKFELSHKNGSTHKKYAPAIFRANSIKYSRLAPQRPTFSQFVTYLLSLKTIGSFNRHWRPQWLQCNVCQWNFQVPGHIETIKEDSNYVAKIAHFDIVMPWSNNHKIGKAGRNRSHLAEASKSKSSTMGYIEELEPKQRIRLYKLYRMDFEMFGYSPHIFHD